MTLSASALTIASIDALQSALRSSSRSASRASSRAASRTASRAPSRSDSQCSCLSCAPATDRPHRASRLNDDGVSVKDYYSFNDVLGEGTFSVVYLAESKVERGGYAAVKVFDSSQKGENLSWLVEKEIEIMSSLDHPHIVHLNEVFTSADTVFLVMELAKGGEVFDRLLERGAFSEAEAAAIVVQLLCAVGYIHDMGIVHRDLKLENILYYDDAEDSKVMVADFGLSEWLWEIQDGSPICGTPGYMAPEVIRDKRVTPAADVWSIGVITYILLAGYPPFVSAGSDAHDPEDDDQDAICRLIAKGRYEFHAHSWSHVSAEAKDFISRVMCVDPSERPSCSEALEHPWLSSSQRSPNSLGADLGTDVRKALDSGRRWSAQQALSFAISAAIIVGSYLSLIAYIFNLKLMSE